MGIITQNSAQSEVGAFLKAAAHLSDTVCSSYPIVLLYCLYHTLLRLMRLQDVRRYATLLAVSGIATVDAVLASTQEDLVKAGMPLTVASHILRGAKDFHQSEV